MVEESDIVYLSVPAIKEKKRIYKPHLSKMPFLPKPDINFFFFFQKQANKQQVSQQKCYPGNGCAVDFQVQVLILLNFKE